MTTMQDAIKSGKPFKRECNRGWLIYIKGAFHPRTIPHNVWSVRRFISVGVGGVKISSFTVEDILATDWEIKP